MTSAWETPDAEPRPEFDDPMGNEEFIEDLPSFARSGRRRPAILMIVITSVSLTAIVVMRSLTGGLGQVFADTSVEQQVNGFLAFLGTDGTAAADVGTSADPFMDLESSSYAAMQVPPERLRSNPFITPWSTARPTAGPRRIAPLSADQRRSLRKQELTEAGDHLRIESVITGRSPLASINDRVRRIGDQFTLPDVDATFVIVGITSEAVFLEARDSRLDLSVPVLVPIHRR